jgi:hypothetical protein
MVRVSDRQLDLLSYRPRTFFVYLVTNSVNEKVYVGKSNDAERRWLDHRRAARAGSNACPALYRAIRKHGEDKFDCRVIHVCATEAEAYRMEAVYIGRYNSAKCGYNVSAGGRGTTSADLLSVEQIRAWGEQYHQRFGRWPTQKSGPVQGANGETWKGLNDALRCGLRGLPSGLSLPIVFGTVKPNLTEAWIRERAEAHRVRHGALPTSLSGPVEDAPAEAWVYIDHALRYGGRGLPGGSSLCEVLGTRKPYLTEAWIREMMEKHWRREGRWPTTKSGRVADAPDETWQGIDTALQYGYRGLPGGSSLRKLRGCRAKIELSEALIIAWAVAHHEQTGHWPVQKTGPVFGVQWENWGAIDNALVKGLRGLPGGSSLSRLLAPLKSRAA